MAKINGLDINRFVDLSAKQAQHLSCSICLNIFDNAINSECRHSFCRQCVQQWVDTKHRECPKCREVFTSRKRPKNSKSGDELVFIGNHVFRHDFLAKGLINDLKIKCDFEYNGCQEVIEFGLLSAHLKQCEHRFCKTCDFAADPKGAHNCIALMKNAINELKVKNQILELGILKAELKNLTEGFDITTQFVLFGTFRTDVKMLSLCSERITLLKVGPNESWIKYCVTIPLIETQELMYCVDPSFTAIVIKPSVDSCLKIQSGLNLGSNSPNGIRFDVNDRRKCYIIAVLTIESKQSIEKCISTLIHNSNQINPQLKCEAIDLNKIQQILRNAKFRLIERHSKTPINC